MTEADNLLSAKQLMTAARDIPWLLAQWAERAPHKVFLVWEPFVGEASAWTYREFQRDVVAMAGGLHARGVQQGDRVLLHLDNSPEFLMSWFACAQIGAVAVSTNTRSVARDMVYFAEHAQVVCAITSPKFARLVSQSAPKLAFLVLTDTDAGEPATVPDGVDFIAFREFLDETSSCPERVAEPMANLAIQFTSGTTSRPKAVLWTHANALWGAQVNTHHMRLQHDDVALAFLPLFHTNAQSYSLLSTLWVGGTLVVQPRFSASRFWEVSLKHRCTWTSLIPFCIRAIKSQAVPEKHDYRFWGVGAHLPRVDERFGVHTIGWWGMTETVTHGIVGDFEHPGPHMCIGRPSMGYAISIRRPDGSPVGPGERGALFIKGVRGVSLFKEYFGNPEATASSFDDAGWFETGDLIQIDPEGNLFFGDRDKDMLKVGAENVAASEIESLIMETGWLEECAVVGQKHYMLDEVPVVFVIPGPRAPADLEGEIIALCKEKLADFKVVRDVHIVDELPRSTLEKIAKNQLRDLLAPIEGP